MNKGVKKAAVKKATGKLSKKAVRYKAAKGGKSIAKEPQKRFGNVLHPTQKPVADLDKRPHIRSRIRAIGNSKGVILNNQLLKEAGIDTDIDVIAYASDGMIIIAQPKSSGINTDISTWDAQFKLAKKKGFKSEGDLFDNLVNEFDNKEW